MLLGRLETGVPILGVPPLEIGSRPAEEKLGEAMIGVLNSED
jgi:hypothetical protein